jgi:hypothetical protein
VIGILILGLDRLAIVRGMRVLLAALTFCAAAAVAPPPADLVPPLAVRVAPAETRVAFASVYLALGDLQPRGRELVGDFEIRVPLFPARGDQGTVALRMDGPLEQALHQGTLFVGKATSRITGHVHAVRCSVKADGEVRIAVTTPARTLQFASRYTVLRPS